MNLVTRADEELLLDLLNTTPVVGGEQVDELADVAAAGRWATERGGVGTAREVAALRQVRDLVQDVARGTVDPQALTPQLDRVVVRPRLSDGAVGWEVGVGAEEMLAARALLAWLAVHDRAPGRLRPCENPECCRFLLDRSNANTARWCSMALCGNRAKARRHYRRTRATGTT